MTWALWASRACRAILAIELGLFLFWPDVFKNVSHSVAAITMVAGVIGVMVANARGFARLEHRVDEPGMRKWINQYSLVAASMVALIGLAVVGHLVGLTSAHTILIVEVVVIVSFLVFWGIQTAELWDYPTRSHKAEAEAAKAPAEIVPFQRFAAPKARSPRTPGP
jgi:small-conductance mechanosensitive channel